MNSKEGPIFHNSIYLQLSQEYHTHMNLLQEAALDKKFRFTTLILSSERYLELIQCKEILSHAYYSGDTLDLFPGITIHVSPLITNWKWVCDFI